MALNIIFILFFVVAFVVALAKLIFLGDTEIFHRIIQSTFDMSKTAVEISIYLIGVITLWMGIMNVGEKGGAVKILSKIVGPFFHKLFPEVPKNHPANGSMLMNISANMLGLDNAATPFGLKAMNELQELNPNKEIASNAQIMFLVLNTSGLTVVPVSVMAIRAAHGSANPSEIFIPILLATFFATIGGLIAVSIVQKINLLNKIILTYLGIATTAIAGVIYYFSTIPQEKIGEISSVAGNLILFSLIVSFILLGVKNKINVYEIFIDGAKDGFNVAIKIIPYLVAMLVAIGVFRASGTLDFLMIGIKNLIAILGIDTRFVDALPIAFMKPLSGSGARGAMVDIFEVHGVDSFAGKLAATFQGSTETTFYTIAVYFGSVGIRKTRYAVGCGLFADLCGIVAAIAIAYLFFG